MPTGSTGCQRRSASAHVAFDRFDALLAAAMDTARTRSTTKFERKRDKFVTEIRALVDSMRRRRQGSSREHRRRPAARRIAVTRQRGPRDLRVRQQEISGPYLADLVKDDESSRSTVSGVVIALAGVACLVFAGVALHELTYVSNHPYAYGPAKVIAIAAGAAPCFPSPSPGSRSRSRAATAEHRTHGRPLDAVVAWTPRRRLLLGGATTERNVQLLCGGIAVCLDCGAPMCSRRCSLTGRRTYRCSNTMEGRNLCARPAGRCPPRKRSAS